MIRNVDRSAEPESSSSPSDSVLLRETPSRFNRLWKGWLLEWICAWLVCGCFGAAPAPGINESHYLTRARHFQDPGWCEGDLFLESPDAQWLFFAGSGWLTAWMSLEAFAWTGRLVVWGGMAGAFVFLCRGFALRGWVIPACLSLWLALNQSGHLAGEWIVGGLEAKTAAWPLVIVAVGMLVRQRWAAALACSGAAASLHFVVGWWGFAIGLTVAAVWIGKHRKWPLLWPSAEQAGAGQPGAKAASSLSGSQSGVLARTAGVWQGSVWIALVVGFAGLVVGAWPSLVADAGVSAAEAEQAARIQVLDRLPHHLYFGGFSLQRMVRFSLLLALFAWLWFRVPFLGRPANRILAWIALTSLLLAWMGLIWSAWLESNGSGLAVRMLRLYWFRMADVLVPLAIALWVGQLLQGWSWGLDRRKKLLAAWVTSVLLLAAGVEGVQQFSRPLAPSVEAAIPAGETDPERRQAIGRNWVAACLWCRRNTPPGSLFLTPPGQQTFHWYAERAEVFCRKHAPQDARSLLEWQRRSAWVAAVWNSDNGFETFDPGALLPVMEEFQADHVVLEQVWVDRFGVPQGLQQVYPVEPGRRSGYCVLARPASGK